MNPELRRLLRLYKQQFWLFGWDARRPEGNLLVQMGFERTPGPASGRIKSSRYHRYLNGGTVVTLWSFGGCWSSPSDGSIFLSRVAFRPRFCEHSTFVPECWDPDHLVDFRRPGDVREVEASHRLVIDMVRWFGEYEAEVLTLCGAAYRQSAQEAWRDPMGECDQLSTYWRNCSEQIARLSPLAKV